VPCWKDFSPRVSAAYDVFGNGKTAVKFSIGRYTTEERLDTAHANNPLPRAAGRGFGRNGT
jgi:hypothetical protein